MALQNDELDDHGGTVDENESPESPASSSDGDEEDESGESEREDEVAENETEQLPHQQNFGPRNAVSPMLSQMMTSQGAADSEREDNQEQ